MLKIRKAAKIIIFILLLVLLMNKFQKIFKFKYGDGIYGMTNFYKAEDNSIDVIFFGSSHVFENVNTGVLWENYGIAGYELCGSVQPLWNTYYYMKEALKTQKPALLVVDCYTIIEEREYIDDSRIIKNNYGLKFSWDKVNSIMLSAPRENWANYMLEYPTYHARYSDLTRQDFVEHLGIANYECWKGFGINVNTMSLERPEVETMSGTMDLSPKSEKYLRKIIELARENDIPLLLIVAPYEVREQHMQRFNRVSQIAEEYDVKYINFNHYYEEIGLDFSKDFADENHLNYSGNVKFTEYLGQYIKNNIEIPDRRSEIGYESYDIMAKDCSQKKYNCELLEIDDIMSYLVKSQNDNYIITCSFVGNFESIYERKDVCQELLNMGIDINAVSENSVWVVMNGKLLFTNADEDYCWYNDVGKYDTLTVQVGVDMLPELRLNNTQYQCVKDGLNILIYDTFVDSLVEVRGYDANNNVVKWSENT